MYNMFMIKNKILSLALFTLITFFASFIGGIATISSKEPWYSTLNKSTLTPPDWIFAPVWTTLYFFMSVAIWLAWHSSSENRKLIYIYFSHVIFNTTWSIVFFVFHNILLALINLNIILIFIVVLMIQYRKINIVSFYLMIPYLLWSIYALFLNVNLLILN